MSGDIAHLNGAFLCPFGCKEQRKHHLLVIDGGDNGGNAFFFFPFVFSESNVIFLLFDSSLICFSQQKGRKTSHQTPKIQVTSPCDPLWKSVPSLKDVHSVALFCVVNNSVCVFVEFPWWMCEWVSFAGRGSPRWAAVHREGERWKSEEQYKL